MSSQERDVVHFFKVVLKKNLLDDAGFLKLPRSFVSKYWKGITSRYVVLTLPNRTNFEVYWLRDENGDVLFRNGWKEFSQHLSLQAAQFLLFRYELKKSNNNYNKFDVVVLSSSGLEIKYPSSCSKKKDDYINVDIGKGQKGQKSNGCSVEIGNGKRQRCPSPPPPRPLVLSDDDDDDDETINFKKMKRTVKEEPESHSLDAEKTHINGKMKASNNDESEALDPKIMKKFHEKVKKKFRSEKHFFVCTIGKTYSDRDLLVIPNDFAKRILRYREGNAKLVDGANRYWQVKIRLADRQQLTITSGWKKFSIGHGLKLGDVCVFELVDPIDVSFRVHIHRFGQDHDDFTPLSPEYSSEQEGPSYRAPCSSHVKKHKIEKANSGFMPKNEFTIHISHATFANHYAVIPIESMRSYDVRSGAIATLQVDGRREWKVKLLYYPQNGYARFSQGWPDFVREFRLKIGDSCRCELIHVHNLKFRFVNELKGWVGNDKIWGGQMIPKSFVRKYWRMISSNPIVLKLPINNVEEKVHWSQRKKKDQVWLEKGWERVVKLCNLQYEFLLTFDLKESSTFEIKVYDKSALQINYPSHSVFHHHHQENSKSMAKVMKYDNGRKALERAEAMCSNLKNPFFVRDMKPSYVTGNLLFIPCLFARKYLKGLKGSGKIWVSDNEEGKKWNINYSLCNDRKGRRSAITGGWTKFREDNELQVGNVCVFEMMTQKDDEPLSFKVHIIKATPQEKETSSHPHQFQADQENMDNDEVK
ncbi:hypothetical protein PIB30_078703, partial [Stylosanthes scabra]|nr:hypothetical protein [Stylosanthes scabra]